MRTKDLQLKRALRVALVVLLLNAVGTGEMSAQTNLIVNPDFEMTSGFNYNAMSEYTRITGGGVQEGQFIHDVTSTNHGVGALGWPANLTGYGGSGYYLLFNGFGGSQNPTKAAWKQTVEVTPNTNYTFTAQVRNLSQGYLGVNPNPAKMRLIINNQQVGADFTLLQHHDWTEWTVTWNSGSATQANIRIVDAYTGSSSLGDAFGIDHLSFIAETGYSVTANPDYVSVCLNTLVNVYVLENDIILPNTQGATLQVVTDPQHGICIVNNTNHYIQYVYEGGGTGTDQFKYRVTNHGVTGEAWVFVTTNTSPTVGNISNPGPICAGGVLGIPVPSVTPSGATGQWEYSSTQNGTFQTFDPNNIPVSMNGKWVRYSATNDCGEGHSNAVQITVSNGPDFLGSTPPIQPICAGQSLNLTPPTFNTNGSQILSQGWVASPTENGTYTPFSLNNINASYNGWYIRYMVEGTCGYVYSNPARQLTVYLNNNITFADANVKAICVANWDTNGDGELSYDEAAAVTDLGQVFRDNSTITSFEELQYFTGLTSIGNHTFYFCTGLTSIQIPSSVTSIGTSAFYDCLGLTSFDIPNSVTTIGDWAFQCCSGLLSIEIPNSVTTLGIGAFNSCIGLTAIEIPNSITDILLSTFSGCRNLVSVVIPNSVVSIGASAFQRCNNLSMIEIPSSVETIGDMAFYNCDGLEQIVVNQENTFFDSREDCNAIIETSTNKLIVGCKNTTIHNSVTSIGDYAFYGCSGLVSLEIPESITSIGYHAFADCTGLISIEIPNSVTSFGGRTFWSCSNLSTVSIGNSVTSIVEGMFNLCTSLTSVEIPNSVTSIGSCAFYGCSGLTSVNMGNHVTSIQAQAFAYCSNLTSITIPSSVISIGSGAFWACNELEQIIVDSGNPVYDSRENCNAIIKTSSNQLIAGCKNSIVPNTVTSIGEDAFRFCENLTSIVIPNSVTLIANNAFSYCSSMVEIIVLRTTPPSLGNNVFSYPNNCLIYVPYEYTNEYRTANRWSNYASRIFPMSYKTIPGYGESENNYRFIASPLVENTAPTAINNLITETAYDLYRFDQSENLEWRNYEFSENTQDFMLENGQGYLYANEEDVNLIFKGNFNEDETKEVGLTFDANADLSGWNLVGNPFPVSAYANRSYYVMNEAGTAVEPVAVSMENAIPACTGVMVKAESTGESVTFSKTAPEMQSQNNGALQITVAEAGTSALRPFDYAQGPQAQGPLALDKAIVSFNAGDQLKKFVFNKDNAQLYIPSGKNNYAIASAEKSGEMPLNFKAAKNGVYTITVEVEKAEMDYLHLIDNITGNDVDLLALRQAQGPANYTFEAKTNDYASRFRLVFSICGDANGDNDGDNEASFAYYANGEIIITADACDASLQVVDAMGRVLVCRDAPSASVLSTAGMAPGVYMLRLINGDDVRVQKIVVR